MSARLRSAWVSLAVLILVLAVLFVVVIPAGSPSDEPAHYGTALFYLQHHRLPTIGERGANYEAQMGPVAYVLFAAVGRAVQALGGGTREIFYAMRSLALIEWLAAVGMLLLVLRRIGVDTWSRLAVAGWLGPNAMFLTMGASVQNDGLALLLAFASLLPVVGAKPLTARRLALAGALAGAATLTKITTLPLLVLASLLFLIRERDVRCRLAYPFAGGLICGWWFVRNIAQYGDPTGRKALTAAGYSFPPLGTSAHAVGQVLSGAVEYLWLPREYLRNDLALPTALKGGAILLTVAVALGCVVTAARQRTPAASSAVRALVVLGLVTTLGWATLAIFEQSLAPRTAYLALPAVALAVGAASREAGARTRAGALVALIGFGVVACVVTLARARGLSHEPYVLFR